MQFTTQAQLDFTHPKQRPLQTDSTTCSAAALRGAPAGRPLTQDPGYNIITGSKQTLSNNVFERFDGRDYRRHR